MLGAKDLVQPLVIASAADEQHRYSSLALLRVKNRIAVDIERHLRMVTTLSRRIEHRRTCTRTTSAGLIKVRGSMQNSRSLSIP